MRHRGFQSRLDDSAPAVLLAAGFVSLTGRFHRGALDLSRRGFSRPVGGRIAGPSLDRSPMGLGLSSRGCLARTQGFPQT